jgi:hypothetical protein
MYFILDQIKKNIYQLLYFFIYLAGKQGLRKCTATKIPFMFPENELHSLSPNFHIHVSARDLYIPRIGPHIFLLQNKQTDIVGIFESLTDT